MIGSNVVTYGALRVLDIVASICSRLCHHFLGKLLQDGVGNDVGHRSRCGGSGRLGGGHVADADARLRSVAEARDLVDVEAQVRVGDSCVIAMDGVTDPSWDLSRTVVTTEVV